MNQVTIDQIVDLERYPVDRPDDPRYRELLEEGRRSLERQALFSMPQFVRAEVIGQLAGELDGLTALSTRYDRPRSAYSYAQNDSDWPADHPRNQVHPCSYNQVLNYQIPNDSPIREIYYWQPLTEFLRSLCGYETFYRAECPHLALSSKIAGEGDTDGWHYDTNDVVFSILLQQPEAGGQFEYVPGIRSETEENYDAVAELFANPERHALKPPMAEGDFNIFRGDLSMHRVTPVEGKRNRIVALFCYDRNPGMRYDRWYIDELNQGLPS